MEERPINKIFGFLLSSEKFHQGETQEGAGFREAYFCSRVLQVRIAEQGEITPEGKSSTCLCYLIDPSNAQRWCMFEKAVDEMLGITIRGSQSLEELAGHVSTHISAILEKIDLGEEVPFDDFSRYA